MGKARQESISSGADMGWASEHLAELHQQFEGVWIAIVDEEVVAASPSLGKVQGEAARETGRRPEAITVKYISRERSP